MQQCLMVVDSYLERMDWFRVLRVRVRGRARTYPFANIPGFISTTHNNQPQRIEDILYYDTRKQSTMSGGVAGRVYMCFWAFKIRWHETPTSQQLSAVVMGA
jgi:hypothetical protein